VTSAATATRTLSARTLGEDLERDRLEHRVRRVTVAIAVLRQLATEQRHELGATPRHLRHAIVDFEDQIQAINARLLDLVPERASVPIQPRSNSR
jgi:hypothetical protein